MAELIDFRTDADQNNAAPPDGAPEGMPRGAVNNTMRETMARIRRFVQAISGELEATSPDGITYTLDPAMAVPSLVNGLIFTFRAGRDCGANPTLMIGSLSANFKKITEEGLVNLAAGDLRNRGVYQVAYVTGQGWILISVQGGEGAIPQAEVALTDQAVITWDIAAAPYAKVTLRSNRTLAEAVNATAGQRVTLRVIQDGGGSRELTWNAAYKWRSGSAPTLSAEANASDTFLFYFDGTDFIELASSIGGDFAARIAALEAFFLTRVLGRLAADLPLTTAWQTVATLQITPPKTTSRIKIGLSLLFDDRPDYADIRVRRGNIDILADHQLAGGRENNNEPVNITLEDTPGVTTAQTYTLAAKRAFSAQARTVQAGSAMLCEALTSGHLVGMGSDHVLTTSWEQVASLPITPSIENAPLSILVSGFIMASGTPSVNWRLKRGNTIIYTDLRSFLTDGGRFGGIFYDAAPGTNARTYSLEVQRATATAGTVIFPSLEIIDKSAAI